MLDSLAIQSFRGREQLCKPFCYLLKVHTKRPTTKPDYTTLIQQPLGFHIHHHNAKPQYFHGMIWKITEYPPTQTLRLLLTPFTETLNQQQHYRTFHHKSTLDIILEIFESYHCTSQLTLKLTRTYPPRRYCTQYQETDWQFIQRLFAEENIIYYFQFQPNQHSLVISDDINTHPKQSIIFNQHQYRNHAIPQDYTTTDYHHEKNYHDLLQANSQSNSTQAIIGTEYHHFPGNFSDQDTGEQRIQQLSSRFHSQAHSRIERGQHPNLHVGSCIDDAIITHLRHYANSDTQQTHTVNPSQANRLTQYHCLCRLQSKQTRYQSPYPINQPTIEGVQTATVITHSDKHIETDDIARIRVSLDWPKPDNILKKNISLQSCWLRVRQAWSGEGHSTGDNRGIGHAFIPWVGQTVMLSFENGNPDRPIVLGCLYDREHQPPLKLPEQADTSMIKTAAQHYVAWNDNPKRPSVTWHAAGEHQITVKHNMIITTKNNDNLEQEYDYRITIKKKFLVKSNRETVLTVGDSKVILTPDEIILSAKKVFLN